MTATLTPTRTTGRRELDHRHSDGIDVTLSWRPSRNDLVLTVRDETGGFELEVPANEVLDAFASWQRPALGKWTERPVTL